MASNVNLFLQSSEEDVNLILGDRTHLSIECTDRLRNVAVVGIIDCAGVLNKILRLNIRTCDVFIAQLIRRQCD
jgi:hypothetical protein